MTRERLAVKLRAAHAPGKIAGRLATSIRAEGGAVVESGSAAGVIVPATGWRRGRCPGALVVVDERTDFAAPSTRRLLADASAVVATSTGAASLVEACAIVSTPVPVVSLRPGAGGSRPRPRRSGELRVVLTCDLVTTVGFEALLASLGSLHQRGVPLRFDVLGDGPERANFLFTTRDLELDDVVVWTPDPDARTLQTALVAADVAVVPALEPGWWVEAAEAAALGVPVIRSHLARPDVPGAVVDPWATEALAAEIAAAREGVAGVGWSPPVGEPGVLDHVGQRSLPA